MKTLFKIAVFCTLFFLSPQNANAIESILWSKANSPIVLHQKFTVTASQVLFIEPGVVVLADSAVQIKILGRIFANGTASEPIYFKALKKTWGGLWVVNSSFDSDTTDVIGYCHFSNSRTAVGGALRANNSKLRVSNCIFLNNTADLGMSLSGYNQGGGLNCNNCDIEISNCTFRSNYSDYVGGAICGFYGKISIKGCLIEDNSSAYYGGGISLSFSSVVELEGNIIQKNYVTGFIKSNNTAVIPGGGGIAIHLCGLDTSLVMINRCNISSNCSNLGAAIFSDGSFIVLSNSLLNGNNSPTNKSYLRTGGDSIILRNNTLVKNVGIFVINNTTKGEMYNTIFAENTPISSPLTIGAKCTNCWFDCNKVVAPNSINCIFGNPLFKDTLNTAYYLSPYSKCVNSGFNLLNLNKTLDLLGNDRYYKNSNIDLGCYEFQGEPLFNTSLLSLKAHTRSSFAYPNPFITNLFIDVDEPFFNIEIYNLAGERIRAFENTKIMDLSDLPSGIYSLILETDNTREVQLIVKK